MTEYATYTPDETVDEKKGNYLEHVQSVDEASMHDLEHNRNGQFHRSFSPRQVHVSVPRQT
jgi:hypothetical protein